MFGVNPIVGRLWELRTMRGTPASVSPLTRMAPVAQEALTVCPQALWPVPQPAQGPGGPCHPSHHMSGCPGQAEKKSLSLGNCSKQSRRLLSLSDDRQCVCVFSCRVITGKFSAPFCLGHWLVLLPKQL